MADRVQQAAATPQMNAALLGLFAVLALVLSAIGVYGVMSYAAAQRVGEMALRLALGARPGTVFALVCRRGLALTGLGLVIGLGGSLLAGRALSALLYDVSAMDPLTYAAGVAVMLVVAAAACSIPAWRAMRTSPHTALRHE